MTPFSVLLSLGYDSMGNNPSLLCEKDKKDIEEGNYVRVSHIAECPKCKVPYNLHPEVQGALWLTRGCDQLVKT